MWVAAVGVQICMFARGAPLAELETVPPCRLAALVAYHLRQLR
jgi:hypothetical protein